MAPCTDKRPIALNFKRCLSYFSPKGSGGQDASVLKALVDRWLRLRKDVIAFTSARIEDGGTGAVMVLVDFG